MQEGNSVDQDFHSNHGSLSKELRLCNVNFHDEQSNGSAGPCNNHSPTRSSEQANAVVKQESHGTSKPAEQVKKALGDLAVVSSAQPADLQPAGIAASCMQEENLHLDERERAYRQGNWVFREILTLLEAKLREQTVYGAVSKRNSALADEKWRQVAEYCRSKGVHRTKEQCRVKWDNMMPDFRKIRDYEEQKEAGALSYFEMLTWERRAKLLPSNMDVDVYQRIAHILSNKPSNRGLKREAREKRLSDPVPSSLLALRGSPNCLVGSNGVDSEGDRLHVSDFVGNHLAASAPRKRRRRKMTETALPNIAGMPRREIELSRPPPDDSSTEDDTTVMSMRNLGITHPYAERSSFFSQQADPLPPNQRLRFESTEALPPSYLSLQNGHHHVVTMAERGNSSSPMDGIEEKGASVHESISGRSHGISNQVEDRKDARHKESLALEREKLAAFREASNTMANAMASAVAMFSKLAEELLFKNR